jgi:hypothetical protein
MYQLKTLEMYMHTMRLACHHPYDVPVSDRRGGGHRRDTRPTTNLDIGSVKLLHRQTGLIAHTCLDVNHGDGSGESDPYQDMSTNMCYIDVLTERSPAPAQYVVCRAIRTCLDPDVAGEWAWSP